jgi:hypothetical protein
LSRSAFSGGERDRESLGLYVLLDFLTGSSIPDLAARYDLGAAVNVEALVRAVLLRHGYRARIE